MNYKKNRLRLNETASGMKVFCFLVKFGLVLIYILKVYRKKSSSIVLRKIKYVHYLDFSFEKHVPSQVLIDSSDKSLETAPSAFLLRFSAEIYFSRIINYWGIIFTLYLTWGAFSLVCVLSAFFFLAFLFLSVFSLTPRTFHMIVGMGKGIIIFLVFHIHPFHIFEFTNFPFKTRYNNTVVYSVI